MTKNRKRSEATNLNEEFAQRRRGGLALPDVVNIDDLSVMLDEDLMLRLRALEDAKGKAYEQGTITRPWEEEIAYVRREQQIRRSRREAFVEYSRTLEEEFSRAEASLPAGDFDNTQFVYAATGGRPRFN